MTSDGTMTFWFQIGGRTFRADPHISGCHTVIEMRCVVHADDHEWVTKRAQPCVRVASDGSLRNPETLLFWEPEPEQPLTHAASWADAWSV